MKRKIAAFLLIFVVTMTGGTAALAQDVAVREIFPPEWRFDIVVDFHGGLAAVEVFPYGDEWIHDLGYINPAGEFVIPMVYRHYQEMYFYRGAPRFTYGTAGIYSQAHGGVAFFDASGHQLTDFIFDDSNNFSEGLAAVRIGGWEPDAAGHWFNNARWGFVDLTGSTVIPLEFEHAGNFSEGLAAVLRGGHWGFIDTSGQVVIPFVFEAAFDEFMGDTIAPTGFSEGFSIIARPELVSFEWGDWEVPRYGVIDRQGNVVVPFIYDWITPFSDGRAVVFDSNWNAGVIDTAGNFVVPIGAFDSIGTMGFSDGFVPVSRGEWPNTRWGFIDIHGNEVIPLIYDAAESFSEGLAAVRIGDWETGRWGFVDTLGNEVIPPRFGGIRDFSEGFAAVWDRGTHSWGFIDRSGSLVVPFQYDHAHSFSEGLAWVGMGGWEEIDGAWRNNTVWGLLQVTDEEPPSEEPGEYVEPLPIDEPTPERTPAPERERPDPDVTRPERADAGGRDDSPGFFRRIVDSIPATPLAILLHFWSLVLITLMVLAWTVIVFLNKKIPVWLLPVISAVAIAVNLLTIILLN